MFTLNHTVSTMSATVYAQYINIYIYIIRFRVFPAILGTAVRVNKVCQYISVSTLHHPMANAPPTHRATMIVSRRNNVLRNNVIH